eukprot:CAMPEP_0182441232 /NCGR_PEP_ID=MMETSP1172-20130603/179_1 /TAXON_ID=708627 /ORGANISM="Timspurckia oligopyrenoides, Strain CCMP3278" /LENGTH=129 /DNA_ID=CAMNT_0024635407 /DNA_START=248 /DNA_END=637 /DNA_ORIENTATION=+
MDLGKVSPWNGGGKKVKDSAEKKEAKKLHERMRNRMKAARHREREKALVSLLAVQLDDICAENRELKLKIAEIETRIAEAEQELVSQIANWDCSDVLLPSNIDEFQVEFAEYGSDYLPQSMIPSTELTF